jgi:hypothetical protein
MQVKELINEYAEHLLQARGVSESTRHQYIHYVQRFLSETFTDVIQDKLRNLQPGELIQYVIRQRERTMYRFLNPCSPLYGVFSDICK